MTDPAPRHPLFPLSDAEQEAVLERLHVGADLLPLHATPAEWIAGMSDQLPAVVAPAAPKPLITSALAHASSGLSPLLVLASGFTPPPINVVIFILGFIAAFLGGLPLPTPGFVADRPRLPATLVPGALALSTVAGTMAAQMPDGPAKAGVALAALGLAWAAGKLVPHPEA